MYEDVLDVYVRLGFPREVITHWTLPKADVEGLLRHFDSSRPLRILEVGTFVGLSTMLIAAHCHAETTIHTVDPNFPLSVELGAMKTPLADCDQTMRQQQLAAAAALELGFSDRITFHAGGFSTGATFASSRADADLTVPVIGPAVCEEHGPFDVIFLDGLHYESTVYADLQLASRYLRADGRLVLHDVIGRWGSNVRRAAWRFVEEHPGFRFEHGRYSSIYDAIGVIRRDDAPRAVQRVSPGAAHPGLDNLEFVRNLATVIENRLAPKAVGFVGEPMGHFVEALLAAGVERVTQVDAQETVRCDLSVLSDRSLGTSDEAIRNAIDLATRTADTILLVATPPGEDVASPAARPVGWWAREFMMREYALRDELRQDFEPMRFAYSTNTLYQVDCSRDCSLLLLRKLSQPDRVAELEELLVEKDRRIEDLYVQGVYTDFLLRDTVQKWISAADHYQRALAELSSLKRDDTTSDQRSSSSGVLSRLMRYISGRPS